MAQNRLHTVFHAMDAKGIFDQNPANVSAKNSDGNSIYAGPQQFPKMYYHPLGDENVINPGEWVDSIRGPVLLGEQKEIVSKVAGTAEEAAELEAAGWWDHPAKSLAARPGIDPKKVPQISSDSRIKDLEAKIAALEAEKARATGPRPVAAESSPLAKLGKQ